MNTTLIQENIIEDFEILEWFRDDIKLSYGAWRETRWIRRKIKSMKILSKAVSQVWLSYDMKDGKLFFSGDKYLDNQRVA